MLRAQQPHLCSVVLDARRSAIRASFSTSMLSVKEDSNGSQVRTTVGLDAHGCNGLSTRARVRCVSTATGDLINWQSDGPRSCIRGVRIPDTSYSVACARSWRVSLMMNRYGVSDCWTLVVAVRRTGSCSSHGTMSTLQQIFPAIQRLIWSFPPKGSCH